MKEKNPKVTMNRKVHTQVSIAVSSYKVHGLVGEDGHGVGRWHLLVLTRRLVYHAKTHIDTDFHAQTCSTLIFNITFTNIVFTPL